MRAVKPQRMIARPKRGNFILTPPDEFRQAFTPVNTPAKLDAARPSRVGLLVSGRPFFYHARACLGFVNKTAAAAASASPPEPSNAPGAHHLTEPFYEAEPDESASE